MRKFVCTAAVILLCGMLCVGVCAEGISYTDSLSGIRFTLPDGWDKMYTENTDGSLAWFQGETGNVPNISFAAFDIYAAEAPENIKQAWERARWSRSDYDNSRLSVEEIMKPLGVNADDVSEIVLKGKAYFLVEAVISDEDGEQPFHGLFRMENGFLYVFYFDGQATHPRYDDFLAMVADAEYPIYSMDEKTTVLWELLIILVSFVLHCLPIVLFRYGIRKAPIENAKEVSVIYGIGAVFAGLIAGAFLDVENIGACAVGIAAGGVLNYKLLSQ